MIRILRAAGAAALVLALAVPAAASVRALSGGRLSIGAAGGLKTLDPARATTDAERLLAAATQCTVPDVLDGPPTVGPDGREVTLHIQPGRIFHDGTPIGADDVARSLARLADPSTGAVAAWRLVAIDGVADRLAGQPAIPAIRATGPFTVVVDLAVPGVDLAARLDDPRLPVVAADGHTGCGPFVPVRPAPKGSHGVALAPFTRAPGGRPYLDGLSLVPLGDGTGGAGLDVTVGSDQGTATGPATEATFLVASGRGDAGRALTLRDLVASALDPAALVRDFVGGSASVLAPVPAPATTTAGKGPGPGALDLAYDPADPAAAAVAGRVQVRLHDRGIDVTLVAVPDLGPKAAADHDLALVTVPAFPTDPSDAVVAAATLFGSPEVALQALGALTGATGDKATKAAAAAWEKLPLVPLYRRPEHLLASPKVLGVVSGPATPVVPADLWAWPLPGAPPAPPPAAPTPPPGGE